MAPPDPTPDIRIISSLIYKGESSDLSPKDYINFFSSYASACGWDLATTKMRLILHIQGNGHPLDWKTKNMAWILEPTTSWDNLIEKFIKDMNPPLGYDEDITVYTGSMQAAGETLSSYCDRMKQLYKKISGLQQNQAVAIMMGNVHPRFQPSILALDCSTFNDAALRFQRIDRFFQRNPMQPILNAPTRRLDYQAVEEIVQDVLASIEPPYYQQMRCYDCGRTRDPYYETESDNPDHQEGQLVKHIRSVDHPGYQG
jgi:hypothetical protein